MFSAMPDPDLSEPLSVVAECDTAIRNERVAAIAGSEPPVQATIREVETAADFVELTLFAGVVYEGLANEGATWLAAMHSPSIHQHVRAFAGMDFDAARAAIRRLVERKSLRAPKPPQPKPFDAALLPQVAMCIRAMISASALYVDTVEKGAYALDRPDVAYRLRRAYTKLQAFLARHEAAPKTRLLSKLYARGSVTVSEFAAAHELSLQDGIVLLQELGAARPVSVIQMTEEERARKAGRLRFSRSAIVEQGRDVEMAAREVIATQRIEDVDARKWVRVS